MSDFGTPAFNDTWRKKGFFVAVDQPSPANTIPPGDYRSLNSSNIQRAIVEMRTELTKMQSALERIAHNVRPGISGGKVDQLHLEQNIIALGGWIASAMETLPGMTYYLSESGYTKVDGFLKQQMLLPAHPSRIGKTAITSP